MYGNQVKRPDSWEDPPEDDPEFDEFVEEAFAEPDDDPGPVEDRDCDYWERVFVELEELADKLAYGDRESIMQFDDGDVIMFNKPDAEHCEMVVREAVKMIMADRA